MNKNITCVVELSDGTELTSVAVLEGVDDKGTLKNVSLDFNLGNEVVHSAPFQIWDCGDTRQLNFTITYADGSTKTVSTTIPCCNYVEPITEQIVYITQDATDINLLNLFTSQYGVPTAATKAVFVVNEGVNVIASTTSNFAITSGNWPDGSTREIRVMTNATVLGRGGNGGMAIDYDDSPDAKKGGDGGTAIFAEIDSPITVNNQGLIAGGGGGGGASGAGRVVDDTTSIYSGLVFPGSGGVPYGVSGSVSKNSAASGSSSTMSQQYEAANGITYGLRYKSPDWSQWDRVNGTPNEGDPSITLLSVAPKPWLDSGKLSAAPVSLANFYYNPDTAETKYGGGMGGSPGEAGTAGTIELSPPNASGSWEVLSAPGQGGLAGYVYQGPVTINNLSGGQFKGHTL